MSRQPLSLSRLSACFSMVMLFASGAARADVYTFEAREQSARTFFSELSGSLGKPVIVSKAAAAKRIGGTFDLRMPQRTFERVSAQMGLIWYSDGQATYLYDASEIKSAMMSLQTLTVAKLQAFLGRSGLHDARYPLRHDGLRTFHVSGPPMYVDLVVQAAGLMDNQRSELLLGKQQIGVIHVRNTFVSDRRYELRDDKVTIPGMATVIEDLLRGEKQQVEPSVAQPATPRPRGAMPVFPLEGLANSSSDQDPTAPRIIAREVAAGNIRVVAYPDTNSLLVKGLPEQVRFIENLVNALDTPKRHVELSLWIIDLHKDELNQLGINWQGAVKSGGQFSASLNAGSATTLDGASFVTQVMALERTHRANVVSRPVILTQENVPAIFDNNRTFYAPLVGSAVSICSTSPTARWSAYCRASPRRTRSRCRSISRTATKSRIPAGASNRVRCRRSDARASVPWRGCPRARACWWAASPVTIMASRLDACQCWDRFRGSAACSAIARTARPTRCGCS